MDHLSLLLLDPHAPDELESHVLRAFLVEFYTALGVSNHETDPVQVSALSDLGSAVFAVAL